MLMNAGILSGCLERVNNQITLLGSYYAEKEDTVRR